MSGYKTFKDYYEKQLLKELKGCFPLLVSYNRFLELKNEYAFPIIIFAMLMNSSKCTGITFVDSFPLNGCHNKHIYAHKTFKGIAKKGVSSMGWFFGFKIHVVINHLEEIMSFCLTPGNIHDASQHVMNTLTKKLWGKLFGDKGYIGADLFKMLYNNGLELITNIRKNIKKENHKA